jgi:hypothetical protein
MDTVEATRMQVCDRDTAHALIANFPFMQMVEQEYEELFPREVEAVHVCYDLADLNGFVKEYEKLKKNLEDLVDDYTSKKRRHKSIKRKKVTSFPMRHAHWVDELVNSQNGFQNGSLLAPFNIRSSY